MRAHFQSSNSTADRSGNIHNAARLTSALIETYAAAADVRQVPEHWNRDQRDQRLDHHEIENEALRQPERLRPVRENVSGENVEWRLLAAPNQSREHHLAPVPPQNLDHRRALHATL